MSADMNTLLGTGIPGLDYVLEGGFSPHRIYLIQGRPGAGKTTLALQFLLEGVRVGEAGLYVTLSETREELIAVAASHGLSLDQLHLFELTPSPESLEEDMHYTVFQPSEVELGETTRAFMQEVSRVKPVRIVFDSLSELRLLAQDSLRYRRQILALKQFFIGKQCTTLFLDDHSGPGGDVQLESLTHGVLLLEQLAPEIGRERRRLRVLKMRGRTYCGGYHDYRIKRGGLEVYPRLALADLKPSENHKRPLSSDIPELDTLLGGGIEPGTSTLLLGAAGTGKSTIALQFAAMAGRRGQRAAVFSFDEGIPTMMARCEGLGIPLQAMADKGLLRLQQIDPAELSPGEFMQLVREVSVNGTNLVVIDSLNGFFNAMPQEQYLLILLYELLSYLRHAGVATLLVTAQHGLVGDNLDAPVDASYLADSVLLLRYFEMRGEVRQAISVLKKRSGKHERTIRELHMDRGIRLGPPLVEFLGVLTGVPHFQSYGSGKPSEAVSDG